MSRRILVLATTTLLLLGLVPGAVMADDAAAPVSMPGSRPVNPNYAQIKAAIDAQAPGHLQSAASAALGHAPVIGPSWQGVASSNVSPGDPTGAIGPDRYIEVVNEMIGIYHRDGTLIGSATEGTWTGFGRSASGDGQILYDVRDGRFYYAMLWINGTNYQLGYGFSKTSTPTTLTTDWCNYHSALGVYGTAAFPDYPKLGVTNDFMLMGVNRFDHSLTTFLGGDIAWVTKPAPGAVTTCPTPKGGVKKNLLNADSTQASTPVPGRQTEGGATGYVIANKDPGTGGTSTILSIYRVSKNTTTGNAQFSGPTTVTVPAYAYPPSAPQQGTSFTLDTLDARLMNAWVAPNPTHGSTQGLFTQHTVAASAGGTGSEVRWYEINPNTGALYQSGKVQDPSLYVFNGAISPDRNGVTHTFGSNIVLGFSTSSSTTHPAIQTVSKIGAGPQSGFFLVKGSAVSDTDFTCASGVPCRWGDYSGASPDPASTGAGMVWLSNQYSIGGSTGSAGWSSWNWGVIP